jgi:hypothetical protein
MHAAYSLDRAVLIPLRNATRRRGRRLAVWFSLHQWADAQLEGDVAICLTVMRHLVCAIVVSFSALSALLLIYIYTYAYLSTALSTEWCSFLTLGSAAHNIQRFAEKLLVEYKAALVIKSKRLQFGVHSKL